MESQDQGNPPDLSQEQPQQDSALQTPQPDQPTPSEVERGAVGDSQDAQPEQTPPAGPSGEPAEATAGPSGQDAEGVAPPPFPAGADQDAEAVAREQQLEADRRARHERLGGEGEVREGEVQAQRQEHNERTGGGDVPQA